MNCATHPEVASSGFCSQCGKGLCPECVRDVRGVIFCEECLAARVAGPAPPKRPPGCPSPGVALVLGLIPGIGAVYNGEYLKGLIHFLIFAGLAQLSASDFGQPFTGLLLGGFLIYMPIEAYQTAKRRRLGLAPPPSGWGALGLTAGPGQATPIGPIVLIVVGVVFLAGTMHIFDFLYFRYLWKFAWPVILIAIGAWMLWKRTSAPPPPSSPEGGSPNV